MYPSINGSPCPALVEGYKQHLRKHGYQSLSFSSFCQENNILERSASQWLRRHGLSVAALRLEVISEMLEEGTWFEGQSISSSCRRKRESRQAGDSKDLKGISITFSDGTLVSIRQAPALSLVKFLDTYNRQSDKHHVLSE